ncbi:TPA: glycosyltransferase, partial [Aeromonas veronii]
MSKSKVIVINEYQKLYYERFAKTTLLTNSLPIIKSDVEVRDYRSIHICYLSRISVKKGFFLLKRIIERTRNSNIYIHVAGQVDPELNNDFVQLSALSHVKYYGFVSQQDKINLLNKSSVMLQLSEPHYEASP